MGKSRANRENRRKHKENNWGYGSFKFNPDIQKDPFDIETLISLTRQEDKTYKAEVNKMPEDKGKLKGACNRSACLARPAVYLNRGNDEYYCKSCMRLLRDANPDTLLFTEKSITEGNRLLMLREFVGVDDEQTDSF